MCIVNNTDMFLCSDCKDRERSWGYMSSAGHCDNKRCENYFYEPTAQIMPICEIITIPIALTVGIKNYKNLTQPKITKYFKTE